MAERDARKGRRPAARRRGEGVGASSDSTERQAQRIKALERERDRLKGQLEEAEARIARLQESRSEAVNRIDWVIDSLHNLIESGA
jgi:hypothetical protein